MSISSIIYHCLYSNRQIDTHAPMVMGCGTRPELNIGTHPGTREKSQKLVFCFLGTYLSDALFECNGEVMSEMTVPPVSRYLLLFTSGAKKEK